MDVGPATDEPSLRVRPLTLRTLRARIVDVPMARPVRTSRGEVRSAPLLLADVETEEGATGLAYIFCYRLVGARAIALILEEAGRMLAGVSLTPPQATAHLQRNYSLFGITGVTRMALSTLDSALWDAAARQADVPLCRLLGAAPAEVPVYNSNGLGLTTPATAATEAVQLLRGGFAGVKLRLGYPTLAEDLEIVRAVRHALPQDATLVVDYNQGLGREEGLVRARGLDDGTIAWIEEPIRHDDYVGSAAIAAAVDTPVQLGENFDGVGAMETAVAFDACDLVMPDIARIGGVTGWDAAGKLAARHRRLMSSHLHPEISVHLLAATATRHWLEYVDWAVPILQQPLTLRDGVAIPLDAPGTGLAWNEDAVSRYQVVV
jgi:mandelate racemase